MAFENGLRSFVVVLAVAITWYSGRVSVPFGLFSVPAQPQPQTVSLRAQDAQCYGDQLIKWVAAHGGRIHAGMKIDGFSRGFNGHSHSRRIRGVFATTHINASENLFEIPDNVSLTAASTLARLGIPSGSVRPPTGTPRTTYLTSETAANQYIQLAVALIVEKMLGSASPYFLYLSCLPSYDDCPSLLCFTAQELEVMADRHIVEVTARDSNELVTALKVTLDKIDFVKHVGVELDIDNAVLRWAYSMIFSRSFVVNGIPRLLPFVDMLNYSPDSGGINVSGTGISHIWSKDAPFSANGNDLPAFVPGNEIMWTYKAEPTQFDLIYHYGIVEIQPGHGTISLDLKWETSVSQLFELAFQIMKSISEKLVSIIPEESNAIKLSLVFSERGIPSSTLGFVRVLALMGSIERSSGTERSEAIETARNAGTNPVSMLSNLGEFQLGREIDMAALNIISAQAKSMQTNLEQHNLDHTSGSSVSSRYLAAMAWRNNREVVLANTIMFATEAAQRLREPLVDYFAI